MASSTQRTKLKALFEQSMEAADCSPASRNGLAIFRHRWEQSVGIAQPDGQKPQRFDAQNRLVDHKEWHVGEVMHTLLGNSWKETFEQFYREVSLRRFEGLGGAVMGGQLPYVSAGLDVIAGLMNARALEAAAAPEWIWDRMCTVEEATGEGGFHIGLRTRGQKGANDLADGQPLPTAEVVQTRVHRNRTLNQGNRTKVNFWAIRDDLTGQIMDAVTANTLTVLAERERKVADAVMGVSVLSGAGNTKALTVATGTDIGNPDVGLAMPVVQDGLQFFPYQKGVYGTNAGSGAVAPESSLLIQNYANDCFTDGLGLSDYTALGKMLQIWLANIDPWTNLPVPAPDGVTLLVAPGPAAIQMKALLQAEAIWQAGAAAAVATPFGTQTVSGFNLVRALVREIVSSQFWANRLVSPGVTTLAANGTYAHLGLTNVVGDTYHTVGSVQSAFYAGDFKRAVHYWQRMPFTVYDCPLSAIELAEQTVLEQHAREKGQAFWVDPRAVYRAWA